MSTYEKVKVNDILENQNGQIVKVTKKFTMPLLGRDNKDLDPNKRYYIGDILKPVGEQKLLSVIDIRGNKRILVDGTIEEFEICTREGIKDMFECITPSQEKGGWVKCISDSPTRPEVKEMLESFIESDEKQL